MSTSSEPDFDLEKLFLPAWAQESPTVNRYAKHPGDDRPDRRYEDRQGSRRPPRRDGPRPAADGPSRPPRGERHHPRREGDRLQRSGDRGNFRRDDRAPERREPAPPLPDLVVSLMPDEKGVDSLARQIKVSGRSFPLFDIAHMILQKPERQQVRFEVKKGPDGQPLQPLFLCAIDDTLWLSEAEAVEHVLGKHFATFYQADKTPTEPPKGTYTFVAQCGISGVILGPPNYHDYQNQLRKLHAERFSRMPFDAFKARVKIVKEEAVVKQWVEQQSFKTEYVCLNVAESPRLASRELVEGHFREVHRPNIIKPVEKHTLSGPASRQLRSPGLQRLLRAVWENQNKFPIQVATILSQQFASRGLQFFKVNRAITHVSVARPHFLDLETTPVSAQVRSIVEFINATPKCTRRRLLEALAPTPKPLDTSTPASEAGAPAATPPVESTSTPEQAALIGDLHWLIHQGHVIEFANGILETAKRPVVKPPKAPKPVAEAAGEASGSTPDVVPYNAQAPGEASAAVAPAEQPGVAITAEQPAVAAEPARAHEEPAAAVVGESAPLLETAPSPPSEPAMPSSPAAK